MSSVFLVPSTTRDKLLDKQTFNIIALIKKTSLATHKKFKLGQSCDYSKHLLLVALKYVNIIFVGLCWQYNPEKNIIPFYIASQLYSDIGAFLPFFPMYICQSESEWFTNTAFFSDFGISEGLQKIWLYFSPFSECRNSAGIPIYEGSENDFKEEWFNFTSFIPVSRSPTL